MSNLKYGPKPKNLTPHETLNSLEIWKNNVKYGLRLNPDFKPYLVDGYIFGSKSKIRPYRLLTDDVVHHNEVTETVSGETITTAAYDEIVKSREDKAFDVDLMLDQIANYAECIPRNDIVKDSESLSDVWQKIKLFYNLQSSGALLNECWNIKRLPEETPQALYARLKQSYDENLITKRSLAYTNGQLAVDEEMSPTLHCDIIFHWLEILHPKLRNLVVQRFATDLRNACIAALFPEISRSVDSLLSELEDDSYQASCHAVSYRRGASNYDKPFQRDSKQSYSSSSYQKKNCSYCKLTGRRAFATHNIEDCLHIKRESKPSQRARALDSHDGRTDEDDLVEQYEEFYGEYETHHTKRITDHVISLMTTDASPVLALSRKDLPADVFLDSGANISVMEEEEANKHECVIRPTRQTARMADGKSSLNIIGETDVTFHRGKKVFHMTALVCTNTDIKILGGMPFMRQNDIAIRPATNEIIIDGVEFIKYNPGRETYPSKVRRLKQFTIQADKKEVLLPGEKLSLSLPPSLCLDQSVAVEPRLDSYHNRMNKKESSIWPKPQVISIEAESITLSNDTKQPVVIKKHEQICVLHEYTSPEDAALEVSNTVSSIVKPKESNIKIESYSKSVKLNPDKVLNVEESKAFSAVLEEYDEVFNPKISRYNGKSGKCFVEVNMGNTLPPQHKGRIPFYGRSNLQELQDKLDELTEKGVFARPQDLGITVENISPSFLVRKPSNPQQKRLVTDFGGIATYCRPTPSLMPKISSVLQTIASWKYIITTDLTESYYQLPLKRSSQRYCGIVSPFKGLLVYCVGCMGLPGVEVALEELTCLILGDLVQLGSVAKVADDIYIGGNTIPELLDNLKLVLHRFLENNLKLSARKTVVAPRKVNILGWLWSAGRIQASPHRLSALAECKPPVTVSAMRSFIGAYRFLSRVLKGYATLLAPLEKTVAGNRSGKEEIQWSDELSKAFQSAQNALADSRTLTMPTQDDMLWIVTDASVQPGAVGATLYAVRDGVPKLAEFFNVKLPEFQSKWLPCEVEGIAIGSALNHFAPYIIQSKEKPQVLTDSKPCVQAVQKMIKGQFSTSARLSTFLSAVSRYQAQVRHVSGVANLPSDFASRHPVQCDNESCQICTFIKDFAESVVLNLSVADILQGKCQVPYKNKKAWIEVQKECPDLRKLLSFRQSGTEPSKKSKNLKAVRRYLSANIIITKEGLLVQRKAEPLSSMNDHIVVPQQVLHGLLSVLHLKLNHPTAYQLGKVFSRDFFALNINEAVKEVTMSCHLCESIKDVPKALIEQSSADPPSGVGMNLAADILIRTKQKILVLRETTTSYTLAEVVPDETAVSVANALLRMCCILRPVAVKDLTIRVDPAPACRSLFINLNTSMLEKSNIHLQIGRELSLNKNPVAEKSIKELSRELLIVVPDTREISPTTLSIAVANLNSRIRSPGLSSQELWTQRDQITGDQLPFSDSEIIMKQNERRKYNHSSSEISKSGGRPKHPVPNISVGSLVYLYADRDKEAPRKRYLVISIEGRWCKLRRFTQKLFGGRTYDALLEECYAVPVYTKYEYPGNSELESDTDTETYTDTEEESFEDREVINTNAQKSVPVEHTVNTEEAYGGSDMLEVEKHTEDDEGTVLLEERKPQEPQIQNEPQIPKELNEPPELATPPTPEKLVVIPKNKKKLKTKIVKPKTVKTKATRRGGRMVKIPDKFKDYVMDDEESA